MDKHLVLYTNMYLYNKLYTFHSWSVYLLLLFPGSFLQFGDPKMAFLPFFAIFGKCIFCWYFYDL